MRRSGGVTGGCPPPPPRPRSPRSRRAAGSRPRGCRSARRTAPASRPRSTVCRHTLTPMTATLTATDAGADIPVAPVEHPELLPPPIPGSKLWGWLWPIAIAIVAGVMRLWTIQRPKGIIFDEVYYTADARDLLHQGVEHNRGYLFTVHPPLGKWMIAGTEGIFGYVKTNG